LGFAIGAARCGPTRFSPAIIASGQSPRTPWQKVPPVNGGTSSCDARPRRLASCRGGAIKERRRVDACRSTVMQTASTERQQNGACPMLHSFCARCCIPGCYSCRNPANEDFSYIYLKIARGGQQLRYTTPNNSSGNRAAERLQDAHLLPLTSFRLAPLAAAARVPSLQTR
jgi:hypothetical protein